MLIIKKHEHGGQVWRWISEYDLNPNEVIDFSANINPLGIPQRVKDRIQAEIDHLQHYPEPNCHELKQQIGLTHHVNPSKVIVGNGASELIDLIVMSTALNNPEFSALIVTPTFSEYKRAINAYGGKVVNLNYINVNNNFDCLLESVQERQPDLVFMCSPNNPTGELIDQCNLQKLIGTVEDLNTTLVIDHSFMPFVKDNWWETTGYDSHGSIVFLYSLTKIYSLPGLRIGYAIASKSLINKIEHLRNQWSVNHLAQVAAKECLTETRFEKTTRELVNRERTKLTTGCKQLGFTPYPSMANFILVNTDNVKTTVQDLWEQLAQKGIFIRRCGNFDGLDDNYFRVAVRLPEENDRLSNELKKIITDKG